MKALLSTILLLGTSTAAVADSTLAGPYQFDHRYDQRYDQRHDDNRFDGRYGDRYEQRTRFYRPMLLAQNVSMMRKWNRDQRPLFVDIDSRFGGLRKLRLDRNEGRMFVDSVVINFADGHQQTVRLNQILGARQPSIHIDLDRGAVTGMYVYGSTMRGRASFDVIGLRR